MFSLRVISLPMLSRRTVPAVVGLAVVLLPGPSLAAQEPPPPRTAIVFFAEAHVDEGMWPTLFEAIREDLADGIGDRSDGLALDRDPALLLWDNLPPGIDVPNLLEVRMSGRCDVVPQADHMLRTGPNGPLAWVERVAGDIRSVIFVDCARLAQVLLPATLGLDQAHRRQAMDQAIAHVVIHEWIHIATQSSSHSARGVSRAALSAQDLIASP